MASKILRGPLRTLSSPRPSIVAWRSARCFATEIASSSSSIPPITEVPISSTIPATPPVLKDEEGVSASALEAISGATESAQLQVGVVVSAGKMQRTVKVRLPGQKWNKYLRKHFKDHKDHLVHDPNSSLNTGDVVSLRAHRAAKHVHHVVNEILVPFGTPITSRPPVPSEAETLAVYEAKRTAKLERRGLRRAAATGVESAIEKLRIMDLEAGVGEKNVKGRLGKKGQKLPKGVLPGGKHAVGKIDERAKSNKEKTMRREQKAEANLAQARA